MKATTPKVMHHPSTPGLLVLGDGHCAPVDLAAFKAWELPHDTACIGRSIKLVEDARHWFNADSDPATILWAKQLKQERAGLLTHTLGAVEGFDIDWDVEQPDYHYAEITGQKGRIHGSSALFAALAGIAMGYERIVLAGCPMDCSGHWYWTELLGNTGPLWLGVDLMAWVDFGYEADSCKVKSVSGYTAKLLGPATKEWFRR